MGDANECGGAPDAELVRLRRELDEFRDFLPDALFEVDLATGRIVYGNRMATLLLGYTPADVQEGVAGLDLLDAAGREVALATLAATLSAPRAAGGGYQRTGTQDLIEVTLYRKDGTPIPAEVQGSYVLDDRREPTGVRFIFRDITERRAMAESLRRGDERLRMLAANAPVVLFALDRTGTLTLCEGKALERFDGGVDFIGRDIRELLRHSPAVLDVMLAALAGQPGSAQGQFGDQMLDIRVQVLRDAEGTVSGAVGVATDVTDLHAASRALAHSQRMEGLGLLAGGVAHDFNNVLTTLLGAASVLETMPGLCPEAREHVELMALAARRGADITGRLLAFARGDSGLTARIDLRDVVNDAVRLARPAMPADVSLRAELPPAEITVQGDASQLDQVVLNLILNARDAVRPGGHVEVRLSAGSEAAVIAVVDDGMGMDAATHARVFEPFFTTKPPGRGTGLGTSIALSLVRAHGGDISVRSTPGSGTEFVVSLPLP